MQKRQCRKWYTLFNQQVHSFTLDAGSNPLLFLMICFLQDVVIVFSPLSHSVWGLWTCVLGNLHLTAWLFAKQDTHSRPSMCNLQLTLFGGILHAFLNFSSMSLLKFYKHFANFQCVLKSKCFLKCHHKCCLYGRYDILQSYDLELPDLHEWPWSFWIYCFACCLILQVLQSRTFIRSNKLLGSFKLDVGTVYAAQGNGGETFCHANSWVTWSVTWPSYHRPS